MVINNKKSFLFIFSLIIGLIISLAYNVLNRPFTHLSESKLFEIAKGDDYKTILVKLENNKIISKDIYTISSDQFIPSQVLSSKLNKKRYNSIEDLYNNIIFHDSRNIYYEDHKVIFWQKVLLPFSCCIIVFIGLPFLFTQIRSTNQTQKIIFGILFGITYFVLSNIIINITLILNIPALIAVFISMTVFILFGTYLFYEVVKKDIPI